MKVGTTEYKRAHQRVARVRGKPSRCEECGRTDDGTWYDWANLTGRYNDPADYRRLCRPCHRRFDGWVSPLPRPRRGDGTHWRCARVACVRGHRYADGDFVWRNSARICKACERERNREGKLRRKMARLAGERAAA